MPKESSNYGPNHGNHSVWKYNFTKTSPYYNKDFVTAIIAVTYHKRLATTLPSLSTLP